MKRFFSQPQLQEEVQGPEVRLRGQEEWKEVEHQRELQRRVQLPRQGGQRKGQQGQQGGEERQSRKCESR